MNRKARRFWQALLTILIGFSAPATSLAHGFAHASPHGDAFASDTRGLTPEQQPEAGLAHIGQIEGDHPLLHGEARRVPGRSPMLPRPDIIAFKFDGTLAVGASTFLTKAATLLPSHVPRSEQPRAPPHS